MMRALSRDHSATPPRTQRSDREALTTHQGRRRRRRRRIHRPPRLRLFARRRRSGLPSDDPVTLTITTFGDFGYRRPVPGVHGREPERHRSRRRTSTPVERRPHRLLHEDRRRHGPRDIVAIEDGWLGPIMEVSDQFVDLTDYGIEDRKADWVDWKYAQATDPDGRVIGYGTDIGPEGVCYNGPTCSRPPASRATARASPSSSAATRLGRLLRGRQAVHRRHRQGVVRPRRLRLEPMINQLEALLHRRQASSTSTDNAELEERFDAARRGSRDGQSAAQAAVGRNGGKSFVDGTFATFVCPGWMLGVVQGNTEAGGGDASTGWDFADVFPGGAANWGGAFLLGRRDGEHKEEAAALADWLTQPEQQIKAVRRRRHLPERPTPTGRARCDRLRRTSSSTTHRSARSSPDRAQGRLSRSSRARRLRHPG